MKTHWGTIRFIATFFLVSVPALAQHTLDCSKFNSRGCQSFNELVAAKDKDILSSINSKIAAATVCFMQGQDSFFVLSYTVPTESAAWKREAGSSTYTFGPLPSFLTNYDDGVAGNSFMFYTTWSVIDWNGLWSASGTKRFGGTEDTGSLSISSDEITVFLTYLNKMKTMTTYSLSIRVATGRFKLAYGAKDKSENSVERTQIGHCAHYGNGIPRAVPAK